MSVSHLEITCEMLISAMAESQVCLEFAFTIWIFKGLCQLNYQCDFFTFSPSSGACWLLYAGGRLNPLSDRITGPKYCNGNYYNFF